MSDWLDTLPQMDTAALPMVFNDVADRARTDGRLAEGQRRYTARTERQAFANARRQSAADRILERLPEAGEVLHVVLDGSFDLCHLIPRIVELAGEPVERLDLMTLGFNEQTVRILCRLTADGQAKRIRLLCSHYFRSVDTDLWAKAHRELTAAGHTLFVARTHAKLQAYEFSSGRTVTMLSSANLRSCKNAEFAVLFSDSGTLAFWRSVIDELIEEASRCAASGK
jgi:hypothetical protein